jgi:hypothetical protein
MNLSPESQMKDSFRKRNACLLLLTLIAMPLVALAFAPSAGPTTSEAGQQAAPQGTVAFTNVNVVPMDSERVLEDHTVVVEDGLITGVGPAATAAGVDGQLWAGLA